MLPAQLLQACCRSPPPENLTVVQQICQHWKASSKEPAKLLQVAAHEFGHVLGLQHTAVSKSLMSPFYIFRYPLSLSEDDKQGIQYLYGKPKLDPEPTPTQPAELPQPDLETNEITNVEVSEQLVSASSNTGACSQLLGLSSPGGMSRQLNPGWVRGAPAGPSR